jgi:hypothetical protein
MLKPEIERVFHALRAQCGPAAAQIHVEFIRCNVEISVAVAIDPATRMIIGVSAGSTAAEAVTDLIRKLYASGHDFFHFCPDQSGYVDHKALAEELRLDIAITSWRPKWVETTVEKLHVTIEDWVALGNGAVPTIPHSTVA